MMERNGSGWCVEKPSPRVFFSDLVLAREVRVRISIFVRVAGWLGSLAMMIRYTKRKIPQGMRKNRSGAPTRWWGESSVLHTLSLDRNRCAHFLCVEKSLCIQKMANNQASSGQNESILD